MAQIKKVKILKVLCVRIEAEHAEALDAEAEILTKKAKKQYTAQDIIRKLVSKHLERQREANAKSA